MLIVIFFNENFTFVLERFNLDFASIYFVSHLGFSHPGVVVRLLRKFIS